MSTSLLVTCKMFQLLNSHPEVSLTKLITHTFMQMCVHTHARTVIHVKDTWRWTFSGWSMSHEYSIEVINQTGYWKGNG